ncbi:hypothetical protein A6V30_07940 [Wohlfahrtiimonas chitiniclastica]|nr:hypothetical protein A6V30_07940 [Wohlfahrtiimonas chitiniclastica]
MLIERVKDAVPVQVAVEDHVLHTPHLIKLEGRLSEIVQMERQGDDLILTMASGKKVVFYGFYHEDDQGIHSELVVDDDHAIWWLNGQQEFVNIAADSQLMSELAAGGAAQDHGAPIWLFGLLGAGAAIGLAAGGGSGGGNDQPSSPASSQNTASTVDTTPPDAADNLVVNKDGNTLTGTGEKGATVSVKDASGQEIGTGKVSEEGEFTVDLKTPQKNGESLTVSLKDPAGNESAPKTVTAQDTTPPDAADNLVVNKDGNTLTGTGEKGATVSVKDASGQEIGTGKVSEEGEFTVDLKTPQKNGESLTVTLKDPAGNESDPKSVTAQDTTPPELTEVKLSEDGTIVTGKTEANATVTVSSPEGTQLGSVKVDSTGSFEIKLDSALTDGKTANVKAVDESKNESQPEVVTGQLDTVKPDAADNLAINKDGNTLTGTGEKGATVSVKDASGQEIGTGTVTEEGKFTVDLNSSQKNGESLTVTLKDPAGNESAPKTVTAQDTTPPELTEVKLSEDGTIVTGKTEANATVTVSSPEGTQLGSVKVDSTGSFEIKLDSALTDGKTANVKAVDESKNESQPEVVTGQLDTVKPNAADNLEINQDGNTLTGTGEKGATVSVKDASGQEIGTGKVSEEGEFTVDLNSPQKNGESLTVTLKDPAGNESDPKSVTAQDTTPPAAADNLEINQDGNTLTGTGEKGATVSVKDASGQEIGTGKVSEEGEFTVDLKTPQKNGESLTVTLKDPAGNESDPKTVTAQDTTPPELTEVKLSEDGTTVTGKTEANATVTVSSPEGAQLGSVKVDSTGSFEIKLDSALTDGKTANVKAVDESKNESQPEVVTGQLDTVKPDVPKLSMNDALTELTITTEPHATVKLYDSKQQPLLDPSGKAIEIQANESGIATHIFDPAAQRGTIIYATATDAHQNESEHAKLIIGVQSTLSAVDNYEYVALDITPTEHVNKAPSDMNKTGFTVVNAGLGPVLDVGLLDDILKNSVQFKVEENQVRKVTLEGNAGGVQIGSTMNLLLYKLNESTGEWIQQSAKNNWIISYLLGGKSSPTEFSLDEGQWMFVMSGGYGVQALTGYTLKVVSDVVLDYGDPKSVKGSKAGNMLTDHDERYGSDEITSGTRIESINGIHVSVNAPTLVRGEHGVLLVKSDGSYTYKINDDYRGYGSQDEFEYQITSPEGEKSEAKLIFDLNIKAPDERLMISNTVELSVEPELIFDGASDIPKQTGFKVANVGLLGPVLSADAIGADGGMNISVKEDQWKELTFEGNAGGVSLGGTYTLYVYKFNAVTNEYILVHEQKDWFTTVIAGKANPITLQFGEGEYKAILSSDKGVSLLTGATLSVSHEKVFAYDTPTKLEGEVKGDVTPDSSTILLKVNDQAIEPGQDYVIKGQYGELTINGSGEYTYSVTKPMDAPKDWKAPYGKIDSFRLVTQDAKGHTVVDGLNIKLSVHQANDDIVSLPKALELTNVEAAIEIREDDVKSESYQKTFTIESNQMIKDLNVTVTGKSDKTMAIFGSSKEMTIDLELTNTTTQKTWTFNASGTDPVLVDTLKALPAGDYVVNVLAHDGKIGELSLVANYVELEQYALKGSQDIYTVTGDLLENDRGTKMIDSLRIGNKHLSINTPAQGADVIKVAGLYGELEVTRSGTYTYKPSGKAAGIERFIYETTSKVGTVEKAVLEIDVKQHVTGSEYNDIVTSTASDDIFTLGKGADTLIFNNLSTQQTGNGGNGHNQWTDFNAQEQDKIDLRDLLNGSQTQDNLDQYLKYDQGQLMVDRGGQGEFEALLTVQAEGLESLLKNIEWESTGAPTTAAVPALGDLVSSSDSAHAPTLFTSSLTESVPFVSTAQSVPLGDSIASDTLPTVDPLSDLEDLNKSHI